MYITFQIISEHNKYKRTGVKLHLKNVTSIQLLFFCFFCMDLKLRLFLCIFPSAASSLSLRLRDTGTRWRHVCPRALSSTLQVADSGVGVRWRSNTHHMRSRSPSQRHLHGHLSLRLSAGHTSGGKKWKRWHDQRFDHPSCNGRRSEIPLLCCFVPNFWSETSRMSWQIVFWKQTTRRPEQTKNSNPSWSWARRQWSALSAQRNPDLFIFCRGCDCSE